MHKKPASPSRRRGSRSTPQPSIPDLLDALQRCGVYVIAICGDDVLQLMPWLSHDQADAVARMVAYEQCDELLPMAIEVAAQDLGFPLWAPRKVNFH